MTNDELWITAAAATYKRPSQHPPGTLVAMAPLSPQADRVSWALRFDDPQGGAKSECLYLINGSPVGYDGETNILRCQDAHIDEAAAIGLGAPKFVVGVQFAPRDWIPEGEMLWSNAKAHVAVGDFGIRLCGYDRYRTSQSHVWIDCNTWTVDADIAKQVGSRASLPAAYVRNWRVAARLSADEAIVIPFEAPKGQD